jgi:O-antigen ligase
MKEALIDLEVDTKKFIYLIPIVSLLGDWILMTLSIFFLFLIMFLQNLNDENSETHIPGLFTWVLLLIWGIYTVSISPSETEGVKYYVGLILTPFLLFYIITNTEFDKKFLKNIIDLYILTATIIGIFSILAFIDSGFNFKQKIASIWLNYNIVSAFLMIVFMFNITFLINEREKNRFFTYLITALIILFGIFLTQTRGVWLAIILSFSFYLIRRPKVLVPALFIMATIVALLGLLFPEVISERFLSVKYFGSDVSSLGRLQAWLSTIELIRENPFLGYGFDSYIHLRDQVFGFYFVLVEHPHNTYLRGLLELGLIGFVLYFSFFFIAVYYSFILAKLDKNNVYHEIIDGLQLSFVGLIIVFIFEPYLSLYGVSAATIWLLISVTYNLKNNNITYFRSS